MCPFLKYVTRCLLVGFSFSAVLTLSHAAQYRYSVLAGTVGSLGHTDGAASTARFWGPYAIAVDSQGNCYVADSDNHTIRKITSAGLVSTLAGSAGLSGDANGTGAAARFYQPMGIAVDLSGNVYVSDTNNQTIRKITPAGVVSTFAGMPRELGSSDGTGSAARFYDPLGLTVSESGVVYVADSQNQTIRKISAAGVVSTLAGSPGITGSTDGTGAAARFLVPTDVAVDSAGNVYVADEFNSTLRKITAAGVVTTIAGSPGQASTVDGTGNQARLFYSGCLSIDRFGTLYFTQDFDHTIRRMTSNGVVSTIGGLPATPGTINGVGNQARFDTPRGIEVDANGNLYIAEVTSHTIRKGKLIHGADFNQDGSEDILWTQTSTGQRGLWLLNGGAYTGDSAMLPTVSAEWRMLGADDFNSDGQADILWQNLSTGSVYVWYMNGTSYTGSSDFIATLSSAWRVAGAGDFNGDSKPDLIWQNTSTGDRYIWFMDGKTYTGNYVFLGNVPTNWTIVASGDMDQDGKPDLLWRNGDTGEVGEWLMDGGAVKQTLTFGSIPLKWSLRQVLDVNGDGKADILWSNLQNGELGAWLMDGPHFTGATRMLPSVPTAWLAGTSPANGAP